MPERPDVDTQPLQTTGATTSGWVLGGRYRVLGRLGRGGMAEVFRAHDELLDRDVAVKVFRTAVDPGSDTNGDVRRELELQSLARLNHPNLITLFDGSVAGEGPAYLVLELVDGPDLATRLADGPLPEPEVRVIGTQIAEALAYVHAHGMVHRDVKPANILLGTDEGLSLPGRVRARLSDFGIVRMLGTERMTAADLTVGTASYVAPEQARGGNVEPPADVYSLALVLIEALTGRRCFDGPLYETLAARLTRSPEIPADLPAPWPALLTAMTATDPAERPTAAEVADSLRTGAAPVSAALANGATGVVPTPGVAGAAAVAGTADLASLPTAAALTPVDPATGAMTPAGVVPPGTGAVPTVVGDVPPRRRRRRGLALLLAAAVVLAALAVGALLLRSNGDPAPTPSHNVAPSGGASTTHRSSTSRPVQQVGVTPGQAEHGGAKSKTHVNKHRSSSAPATSTRPAPRTSSATQSQPAGGAPDSSSSVATTSSSTPSTSSPASSSSDTSSPGDGDGEAVGSVPPTTP